MIRLTIAACTLGCVLLGSAASASNNEVVVQKHVWEDRPTIAVRYSDLDLDSPSGRDALDTRLVRAVKSVCGAPDLRELQDMALMRDCRVTSLARAHADRDALMEMRMATRGNPERLAALDTATLRVGQ
ncbi:UrcA family protein [Novosphingobium sp. BW1]|uniref:UrcA family protein n=1 Tax=Novosphingobium sp. BW1 TaxID=2592621 RepID=UPI0011DED1EF|nr:UrcA family protein [Novosphingobium sp. BW1]TYC93556.1 UrcA family protein [Novosphingobium sp. BW1]